MPVVFIPNPKGQFEVLRTPHGPVGRHLQRLGNKVQRLAKRQAGKKTGALARSIDVHLGATSAGLFVKVGSRNRVAYMHHEGTRAHIIVPRNAQWLRFFWAKKGRVVYSRLVHHPGTRGNPYLTRSMDIVVRGY